MGDYPGSPARDSHIVVVLLALIACAPREAVRPVGSHADSVPVTVTGFAMGGETRIIVRCPVDRVEVCRSDALEARSRIETLELLATDWLPSGEIAALNAAAGAHAVELSPAVYEILGNALEVAKETNGAFDPTIGALWGLWDFDTGRIPSDSARAERLRRVDWRKLTLLPSGAYLSEPGMAVTLGGIAQGAAAEMALASLQARGREAIVDVSGDLATNGCFAVGIQHPRRNRGESFAELVLCDAALSTSGDYEHFFERDGVRYHHILDPQTGLPATGAFSATVVHENGAIADALATALVVLGPAADVVDHFAAWALVVTPDGRVHELGAREAHVKAATIPNRLLLFR